MKLKALWWGAFTLNAGNAVINLLKNTELGYGLGLLNVMTCALLIASARAYHKRRRESLESHRALVNDWVNFLAQFFDPGHEPIEIPSDHVGEWMMFGEPDWLVIARSFDPTVTEERLQTASLAFAQRNRARLIHNGDKR